MLVTGATGYVGSRLIPALVKNGHTVLAASRSESGTDNYAWDGDVETRTMDVSAPDQVAAAVAGVDAVIYLVHSMDTDDFARKDREAAQVMARACERAGVKRIVYLSGLVPEGELSDHLDSRREVEQILMDAPVPAVVLRASMVIGAGSTSYELLKRLSDRVPYVTPVPAWMRSRIQPIAVEDVVHLIVRALRAPDMNIHLDVGGDDILTYPELLSLYADVAGLDRRRVMVPGVPVWLVGRACAAIAQMPVAEVATLVASLRHDMICTEDGFRSQLLEPGHVLVSVEEALRRSLQPHVGGGTSRHGDIQAAAATDPS